ncbi:unnamed protein product [Kuraishia capsulata CBS 1993]|uniref:TLC domain-containing protein n=1 Tax=Kuraishia capsulata CBS 1993 TaxID=1382522 RepID=W6MKU3_9ASCO|nr:uncharacterized protein KUCA_T00001356001 [Kuraishia capsulata CBS 1993]CDK25387.1 unnamed protein product [Kuraishia capsulata CBS 1993]
MTYEKDYLLALRPFPENPTSLLGQHWHEIVISFAFYEALYFVSPLICRTIFGDLYSKDRSKKEKINFDIHVVSMVQALASLVLCVPMFYHPLYFSGAVFGSTPYGGLVASLTVGYFIWDLVVCVQHYSLFGFGFLLHAVAALYVFLMTFMPFMQPHIPSFLIFELSTPFVNVNWYCSRLPTGSVPNKLILINGLLLMISFFTVRILWGFYAAVNSFLLCLKVWDQLPVWLPVSIFSLNIALDCLNLLWFYKMVLIAKKKARGAKSSKPKEQ